MQDLRTDQYGLAQTSVGQTNEDALLDIRPDPDIRDLIPTFMENRRNELRELKEAVAKSDFMAIRRIGHTWKGICRPYGFIHLETLSKLLEHAAEQEDKLGLENLIFQIGDHLQKARIL